MHTEAASLGKAESRAIGAETPYRPAEARRKSRRTAVQAAETTASVPILMYHSIDDAGPKELAPYRLKPAAFESQIRYLADQGYHSISLEEWADAIATRKRLAGRPVIITFDDGYLNFLQNAWPILEDADLTATMFIVTNKVGQTADWDKVTGDSVPLMSWDDLRKLRDRGLMIGSHTASHPSLLELSADEIIDEGKRARQRIREELGIDTKSFAFPYGHTDERVRASVAKAGYTIAVGTYGGTSTWSHDRLNLPRIEIFPDDSLDDFAAKVAHVRPHLNEKIVASNMNMTPQILLDPPQNSEGDQMLIHPAYAQKLAAQLDALVGNFVALHSQLVTAAGQGAPLQSKVARLFRQPITGALKRNLGPYETLSSGICVGFENEARVMLSVEPKSDYGSSPENCVNVLEFDLSGQSRWLALEFSCDWADISSAQRFQFGIYGTVNRDVPGRGVLRLPGKDGNPIDVVFATFDLKKGQRNLNMSGELPKFDFIDLDTDRKPILLVDLDTSDMPNINFRLNYLSVYFD